MLTDKKQILALAPDDETAKRANSFGRSGQWVSLEGNENILWGTAKTRARNYTTWIYLPDLRFQCTCNNRMPCRHALGLLIVYMFQSENFRITYDIPEDIAAWLKGEETPSQPSKQEIAQRKIKNQEIRIKNKDKRFEMMTRGVVDLQIWLKDLVQQGLASIEDMPPEFWNSIAARMVDAKLGSIGRRIRMMQYLVETETDWHEKLLVQLGELYLIVKGFENVEKLPNALQQEMLNLAGVNAKKEDILHQKGITDIWMIVAQTEGKEEKLAYRRTWILGQETKSWGMLLDFAWGRQGYQEQWNVGKLFKGEIVYYPSSYQLRCLVKKHEKLSTSIEKLPGYPTNNAFLTAYSNAIAQNPWLLNFPYCVKEVIPILEEEKLFLLDKEQQMVPVKAHENDVWKLLAISGGTPIRIFGEWNGLELVAKSAFADERFIIL